jgi:hypothetical protein
MADRDPYDMTAEELEAITMSEEPQATAEPEPETHDLPLDDAPTEPEPPSKRTYRLKRGEDVLEVDEDKLVAQAQKGWDYEAKMHDLNQRRAELERREQEIWERQRQTQAGSQYGAPPMAPPQVDPAYFRDEFERDPLGLTNVVAQQQVAPLREELAELKAMQDPNFNKYSGEYQKYRQRGAPVIAAQTMAERDWLRSQLAEKQAAEEATAVSKDQRAAAATMPTSTGGGPAVAPSRRITQRDLAKMSAADLEKAMVRMGVQIEGETY